MECLESTCRRARSQCSPSVHRVGDSCEVLCSQILKLKQIAQEVSCVFCNNHCIRLSDSLEARGQVRGFVNDAALVYGFPISFVADDHEARGNSNPRLQRL